MQEVFYTDKYEIMNNSISIDPSHIISMIKDEALAKEKKYRLLIDGQAGLLLPHAQSSNCVGESSVNDQRVRGGKTRTMGSAWVQTSSWKSYIQHCLLNQNLWMCLEDERAHHDRL